MNFKRTNILAPRPLQLQSNTSANRMDSTALESKNVNFKRFTEDIAF